MKPISYLKTLLFVFIFSSFQIFADTKPSSVADVMSYLESFNRLGIIPEIKTPCSTEAKPNVEVIKKCLDRQLSFQKMLSKKIDLDEAIEGLVVRSPKLIVIGENHYDKQRLPFYRKLLSDLTSKHGKVCLFLETGEKWQPYVDRIFKGKEQAAQVLKEVNSNAYTPLAPDWYKSFEGLDVDVFAIDLSEYPSVSLNEQKANDVWNERNQKMADNLIRINNEKGCQKSVLINGAKHVAGNSSATKSMKELLAGKIENTIINVQSPGKYSGKWYDPSCKWNPPYQTNELSNGEMIDENVWANGLELTSFAIESSVLNNQECSSVVLREEMFPQVEQNICHFDMTIVLPEMNSK